MTGAPLSLGQFERTGEEYLYDGAESLITIARPGRGKSQAHVIRNLLYLKAPAFVLDVKPEIAAATGRWRAQNVGPIQRFIPSNPALSVTFNPLDFVAREPVAAYRDINRLVPLLVIPSPNGRSADFWEGRAEQILGAALFDVTMYEPTGARDMPAVVDWFSPTPEEMAERIERLKNCGIRSMARVGIQLQTMPEKVRESIFESARRHIEIWGSPELEDLVSDTTMKLSGLRRANGTLYLCVTPQELTAYASIIRTIFGLMLHTVVSETDAKDLPPVTFFLDEFPQLGYMREIEQMLALGRAAGLRLWLFAQTIGQIKESYRDADKILDMMALRAFIEPTGSLANDISKELGTTNDVFFSGGGRPIATAQELMGPAYVGKVIVLEGGRAPARLNRIFAFEDPAIMNRLS